MIKILLVVLWVMITAALHHFLPNLMAPCNEWFGDATVALSLTLMIAMIVWELFFTPPDSSVGG